jgi:hypothetical protein
MRRIWWCVALVLSVLVACAHEPGPGAAGAAPRVVCPPAWTTPPQLDAKLTPSGGALRVLAHASAKGTQNYVCTTTDGGASPSWVFVGPDAMLADCVGYRYWVVLGMFVS